MGAMLDIGWLLAIRLFKNALFLIWMAGDFWIFFGRDSGISTLQFIFLNNSFLIKRN